MLSITLSLLSDVVGVAGLMLKFPKAYVLAAQLGTVIIGIIPLIISILL